MAVNEKLPLPYFAEHKIQLSFGDTGPNRLRVAQLGAAWSAASHFTLQADPALVVMPTGSGKTAVMTLMPFLLGTSRALVVTPSQLVRDQVVREFKLLGILQDAGLIPSGTVRPKVTAVKHRLSTTADWEALAEFDVIVGTPNTLSPATQNVAQPPDGLIDLVLVDEAHHSAAITWGAVLNTFAASKRILFTATPFRRDQKAIPGDLVYQYPLAAAIQDGIYQPVHYVPVPLATGQDRDQVLASFAKTRMDAPEHHDAGSKLLVRTDRVAHASELVAVYEGVGLRMGTVDSHKTLRTNMSTINALAAGDLDGVVSVGVLGEGFDLPALKIAVYHERHKSLPATLQFVGRIARTGPQYTRAELLAIQAEVNDETRVLYDEDAHWATLIPELSEAAVDREQQRRRYLTQFEIPEELDLSPYMLRPQLEARIYVGDLSAVTLTDTIRMAHPYEVVYQDTDQDESLLVVITVSRARPRWTSSSQLDTLVYELHICVADRNRGLLFVSSTTDASHNQLLRAIKANELAPVDPRAMTAVLAARDVKAYSAVGMRSARAPGRRQPSYKMLAGRQIEDAVTQTDGRAFGLGHAIGTYQKSDGSTHGVGISLGKNKVWEMDSGGLLEYREWCEEIGEALVGGSITGRIPGMSLVAPERLEAFSSVPLGMVWSQRLLQMGAVVVDGERQVALVSLDTEVRLEDEHACLVKLISDLGNDLGTVRLLTTGAVDAEGPPILVHSLTNAFPTASLHQILQEVPPTLYFANGVSVIGTLVYRGNESIESLPADRIQIVDWSPADIKHESTPAHGGLLNIHDYVQQRLVEDTTAIVIKDDGTGEIADFVVLRQRATHRWEVELHHCKASSEATPGARVGDLYEVGGQAIKSIRWAQARQVFEELRGRLQNRGYTSAVSAHEKDAVIAQLEQLIAEPPETTFTAYLIQPGLSVAAIQSDTPINTLLVSCAEWLSAQGLELIVVGSA